MRWHAVETEKDVDSRTSLNSSQSISARSLIACKSPTAQTCVSDSVMRLCSIHSGSKKLDTFLGL